MHWVSNIDRSYQIPELFHSFHPLKSFQKLNLHEFDFFRNLIHISHESLIPKPLGAPQALRITWISPEVCCLRRSHSASFRCLAGIWENVGWAKVGKVCKFIIVYLIYFCYLHILYKIYLIQLFLVGSGFIDAGGLGFSHIFSSAGSYHLNLVVAFVTLVAGASRSIRYLQVEKSFCFPRFLSYNIDWIFLILGDKLFKRKRPRWIWHQLTTTRHVNTSLQ